MSKKKRLGMVAVYLALATLIFGQAAVLAFCDNEDCAGIPYSCPYGSRVQGGTGPACCDISLGGCCQYQAIYYYCVNPSTGQYNGFSGVSYARRDGLPDDVHPDPSTCPDPPNGDGLCTGGSGGGE